MLYKKNISTPVGELTIVASNIGVQAVLFESHSDSQADFSELKESKSHPILLQCEKELTEYFKGERSHFSVPLEPKGTEFQKQVWSVLGRIPYGKTISYSEQAEGMGRKESVRAVAAANGRNPIAIIIPCHRVIASTGHLHGYAGGLNLKRKLLELEGIRIKSLQVLKSEVAKMKSKKTFRAAGSSVDSWLNDQGESFKARVPKGKLL